MGREGEGGVGRWGAGGGVLCGPLFKARERRHLLQVGLARIEKERKKGNTIFFFPPFSFFGRAFTFPPTLLLKFLLLLRGRVSLSFCWGLFFHTFLFLLLSFFLSASLSSSSSSSSFTLLSLFLPRVRVLALLLLH